MTQTPPRPVPPGGAYCEAHDFVYGTSDGCFMCKLGEPPKVPGRSEFDEARERRARADVEARRAKLAADMRQLVADAEHWNRTHPNEEPIVIDPDISKDVARRLAPTPNRGRR